MKVSKVMKGLALHLKYCYTACMKRNRKLSKKVYKILNHVMGDHNDCDAAWCYDVKAKEENKVYNPPKEHRLDKGKDLVTYMQLKKFFDQYASVQQMAYCNHPFNTQTNESLNQSIAAVASKNTCYSDSISLQSRISIVIECHNLGHLSFSSTLLSTMGVEMTHNLSLYLKKRDGKKKKEKL
jgi:hypothetical protein